MSILIAVVVLGTIGFFALRASIPALSPQPENVGTGELVPCPGTPNCVSTLDDMQPMTYEGETADAQARLMAALNDVDRLEIVTEQPGYIHAITRSPTMGYIDDLEFVIADGEITFRSAARLGSSDLGVNRTRMEQIIEAFNA